MKKKNRVLSVLLAACLTLSGVIPGTGVRDVAADESTTTIIDVTDYGVYPDSGKDSSVAIQDAIDAAKEASDAGKTVTINFPEGRYDFYPDKAEERTLYISNTSGTNSAYKNKKIGILLEDMDNVTVDGNGSLFMFHGKMTTFAAIDCKNVKFEDFAVDFQVPTVIDITVESVEGNQAVVYVPECYNYQINGTSVTWLSDESPYTGERYWSFSSFNHVQYFDTLTGLKTAVQSNNPALTNVTNIEDLGDNRLQITYSSIPSGLSAGMCYESRPTVRDHAGTFFWKCEKLTLEDLDIHFLHGFGMVGQHSDTITLRNVDFEVPQGSGRATASYADFVQMSGCKGQITIEDCDFLNAHDDPINIHGTFNKVVAISSDRKTITVEYEHNETAGFPNYFVGDKIEFMTAGNMIAVEDSVCTVEAVDGPDGKGGTSASGSLTQITLTLEEEIPSEVQVNSYVVENITYTPDVLIKNCVFKEVSTRGILVTTRGKVVIDKNHFDGTRMASIYISNDAQSWWESGPVRNMTISNNTFTRGNAQAIWIEPTNPSVSTDKTVHSNITITGNKFYMNDQRVLDTKSVSDLTFKDNYIYRQEPLSGDGMVSLALKDGSSAELNTTQSAELVFSGSGTQLSTKLYNLIGCKNVLIEGNTYDGGLNAGSSLSSMSASDVTVTDDIAVINGDNKTDKDGTVTYVSDNESVVKVSVSGTVTAVGAGTANVTAYMTVGGRKFQTDPVTFTVNGTQTGAQPTGITLSADKENINVNETVTYTAELSWAGENNADASAVTWKVYDAKTGAETDKAVVENGVLTAKKAGSVVVTASTVNGHTASKLVSIWQEGKVAAPGFTVEYAGGSDNYYVSDSVEGGLVQNYGYQGLYQSQTPSNILVTDLPEGTDRDNMTVIFKLTGTAPDNSWGDAGIYLYDDADNYVSLQKKNRGSSNNSLAIAKEENQVGKETWYISDGTNVAQNPVWLKLVKSGNTVTAYFKGESDSDWTTIGSRDDCGFLSDGFKLAIATQNPTPNSTTGSMTYSDLTVDGKEIPLVADAEKPVASNVTVSYAEDKNLLTASGTSTGADVIVKWAAADTENGSYSVISGAEGANLTAGKDLKGKYVKAAYIPAAATGATGDIVWSQAVQVTGEGAATGIDAVRSADAVLETASVTCDGNELFNYVKGTVNYLTTADADQREISYNFAAEDKKAVVEVTVNGTLAEKADGDAILQNGRNVIEVKVTAEDKVTVKVYRFIINRTGDSSIELFELRVNNGTVGLKNGVYEYSCIMEKDAASAMISAVAESDTADVKIVNGKETVGSGESSAVGTASLQPGLNEVIVQVTPETGAKPAYYTLKLKVPSVKNARLETLSFDESVTLTEKFDGSVTAYQASTSESYVTLQAAAEEADAKVKVYIGDKLVQSTVGEADIRLGLQEGENTVRVTVVSADGSVQKTYEVKIQASGTVWLSDLNWTSESSGDSGNPTRKDLSCGGNTMTLWDGTKEVTYEKGVGSHAPSSIEYDITGLGFTTFSFDYGVDREAVNANDYGSIVFKVYLDNASEPAFTSAEMKQGTAFGHEELDVTGVSSVRLVMEQGTNNWNDHGDWADAKFTKAFVAGENTPIAENPFTDVSDSIYYYDAVMWAVKNNITTGTTKTTFSPDADCTRAQVVMFLWKAAGCPEVTVEENPFSDVNEGGTFYKAIMWAYKNGITLGYQDGTFRPLEPVKRAEYVTFQYRAANKPTVKTTVNPFTDVTKEKYPHFYNAIMWAYENGITLGKTPTTFEPETYCSRSNVVSFIYRANNK